MSTALQAGFSPLQVVDSDGWRAWLKEHAHTDPGVWLLIRRAHADTPGVGHGEAVEEALCFGWIDGLARTSDDDSWCQRFSPRNPRSAWSTINRARVARLETAGRMAPSGLAMVEVARITGTWTVLADAQDGVVPSDLRDALDAQPDAAGRFADLSPSRRRAVLEPIALAKRPETRCRRIEAAVSCLAVPVDR